MRINHHIYENNEFDANINQAKNGGTGKEMPEI
jgi:hypothetical protein